MINKTLNNIFKGDKVIWMVFFFLCIISIVEVYSASSQLTYKAGNYIQPIVKHIGLLFVGVCFMVVTLNIRCRYFKLAMPFLLGGAFLSLMWVLLMEASTNGAQRWMSILGVQFQPSEVAKGALVLTTAQILSVLQTEKGASPKAMKYILIVCLFIIPPIFVENFSTAVLLSSVIFMMMVVGRVPTRQLGKLLGVVVLTGVVAVGAVMLLGDTSTAPSDRKTLTESTTKDATAQAGKSGMSSPLHRLDTWKRRLEDFGKPGPTSPRDVDLDRDAQKSHANIAIASSNFVGKGPGNSEERDFMSQAFSDFIYAIIIEETGIFGAAFVAMLYIILLFRTGHIAARCRNNFPALLAMGLALLLVTQALFNMCVAVGLAPVTGQPLPLISKGGTSSIINCVYIGMILSISRTAERNDTPRPEEPAVAVATA